MNWIFLGVMTYVVAQIGIGAAVSRRMRSEDDYLLAGRRLGLGMATMTVFATWFGAETCVGSAGSIYADGLSSSRTDPFGYALCILFLGIFFASGLWRRGLTTIGDLFRIRYGLSVEKIAVVLMIPTSLFWAAAQIRAFGQVVSASSTFEVEMGIAIAAAVVIIYTAMGGLMADAITDMVQGIALIGGLLITAGVVLYHWPAPEAVAAALSPERLAMAPAEESWLLTLESWSIPIIGSLFAQELIARTLAARSPQVARHACLLAAVIYVTIGMLPLVLGLLGPALVPNLEDPEQVLPAIAQAYLPPVLYMVFAGALISAILSTVDSALLAAGALASHNLIIPILRVRDERMKLRISRVAVVCLGIFAYVLAQRADRVLALVEESSAFGSAGIITAATFAFLPRFGGKWSALAALLGGMAAWWVFAYELESETPYLLSLAVAVAGYVGVALIERVEVEAVFPGVVEATAEAE